MSDELDQSVAEAQAVPVSTPDEIVDYVDMPNGDKQGFFFRLFAPSPPLRTPAQALSVATGYHNAGALYPNLCDRFVARCYGRANSGYASAKVHYNSIPAQFKHASPPRAGSELFWSIGQYGHTALAIGDGTMWSNMGVNGKIIRVAVTAPVTNWGAIALHWCDPYYAGKYRIIPGPVGPKPPVPGPKPTIDLSNVQDSARIDPKIHNGTGIHRAEVNVICKALIRQGLLSTRYINNGSYGPPVIQAYSKWQNQLGYSGKDADGIPGMVSLTKLGQKYGFNVRA